MGYISKGVRGENGTRNTVEGKADHTLTAGFPQDSCVVFRVSLSDLFSLPKDCLKVCETQQIAG